jgi:hypothetical protein
MTLQIGIAASITAFNFVYNYGFLHETNFLPLRTQAQYDVTHYRSILSPAAPHSPTSKINTGSSIETAVFIKLRALHTKIAILCLTHNNVTNLIHFHFHKHFIVS